MMGLGIKRNEILVVERKHAWGARKEKGRKKFSHKDHAAHRWRKESKEIEKKVVKREENVVIDRGGESEGRPGFGTVVLGV